MCSHYQALKDQERMRKYFAAHPSAEVPADMWPRYIGVFVRRADGAARMDGAERRERSKAFAHFPGTALLLWPRPAGRARPCPTRRPAPFRSAGCRFGRVQHPARNAPNHPAPATPSAHVNCPALRQRPPGPPGIHRAAPGPEP